VAGRCVSKPSIANNLGAGFEHGPQTNWKKLQIVKVFDIHQWSFGKLVVRAMLSRNDLKPCRALFDLAFVSSRTSNSVVCRRFASSKRWVERQSKDRFAREARVQGLKSRAAFKLLQINDKYRLFKAGQTVVDLGYAPGSWSQVRRSKAIIHCSWRC